MKYAVVTLVALVVSLGVVHAESDFAEDLAKAQNARIAAIELAMNE